jgi:hypothetical protein
MAVIAARGAALFSIRLLNFSSPDFNAGHHEPQNAQAKMS